MHDGIGVRAGSKLYYPKLFKKKAKGGGKGGNGWEDTRKIQWSDNERSIEGKRRERREV